MRFDLSDEDWALLEPLMPKARKSARADDRRIMNAIFYVLRTGMPWRDLPERYGPYTTAYTQAADERTRDPSLSHRRPRLGCFAGTFSPSRRQIRSTRLTFTTQPAFRNSAVMRR
jgi:transposase